MTKKILVQIESDDSTRFHCDDADLCEWLHLPISAGVNAQTSGAKPRITITPEEQPETVPIHHHQPTVRG